MSSELNGVQARIKEKVPEAMFTHCYAHKLNLVLLHSAKCMPECRKIKKPVHCHSSAMLCIDLIRMFVNKGCQGTSGWLTVILSTAVSIVA